jgi:uncharacterized Zn finger protein (UPF0148 family)
MTMTALSIKCHKCKVALIRETEPPTDRVFCPTCGAVGLYEQVAKEGAGLIGGIFTQEELVALRRKAGIARE